jgi:hypothetical protein
MDLDALANAAAAALIRVAGTPAGQSASEAIARLYRRFPVDAPERSAAWLTDIPQQVQAAHTEGGAPAERRLEAVWAGYLRQLLRVDPAIADELRQVIRDVLLPALGLAGRVRIDAMLTEAEVETGPVTQGDGRRRLRGDSPFRGIGRPDTAGSLAAPASEPARPRRQLISTGFTLPDEPAGTIDLENTLIAGMPYLYWFEISNQLARGAIDDPGGRELPLRDPAAGTPLTVALFAFPEQIEITAGEDIGEFTILADGTVQVTRQAQQDLPGGPSGGRRLLFPVRAPDRPGQHRLRASLYCRQTLLQSRLIEATVTVAPAHAPQALRSSVDFAVSSALDPDQLASIKPLRLSMLLNDNGDGTHGFRFLGEQNLKGDATLDAGQLADNADRARDAYRLASWNTTEEWTPADNYAYRNRPDTARLCDDLIQMARPGFRLWANVAGELARTAHLDRSEPDQAPVRTLQQIMRKPGFVEVATKVSARMVVPAAIFYDYPLDTLKDLHVCPDAIAAITGGQELDTHPCFLGDCPSYADQTVVCPGGFWGFRHSIGLPQSRDETGSGAGDQIDTWSEIRCEKKPEFVIGIAQEYAGDHVARVRSLGDVKSQVISDRDELLAKLREETFGAHVVYFICHGALVNGIPALVVGPTDALAGITPENIQDGSMFWKKTHPLVILNGCSTAALEPKRALNLVDAFVRDAYASGVIGTEVTIFPSLATRFADEFFSRFLDHDEPVGEAVRQSRLSLLAQGNPLGLVYIVYAAPRLLLIP